MKNNVSYLSIVLVVLLGVCTTACSGGSGVDQFQSRYFNRGSFGQVTPCGHQACAIDY